jgi:hypothetical protein
VRRRRNSVCSVNGSLVFASPETAKLAAECPVIIPGDLV